MNVRNQSLLKRIESHSMKGALEKALAVSEAFSSATARIKGNSDLSPQGRDKEVAAQARRAIRDLRDIGAPIDDARKRRDSLREGVTRPQFDKSDIVGAWNRTELRGVVASLPMVERMKLLLDPQFRDAVLEQPALVSGLREAGELQLYTEAKNAQLSDAHGPRLREIEQLDSEIQEASAVLAVARGDIKSEMRISDNEFEEFAKPIESRSAAPWLKRDKDSSGRETILRISPEERAGSYSNYVRPATADEIRDGRFYSSHAEYLADRGAA